MKIKHYGLFSLFLAIFGATTTSADGASDESKKEKESRNLTEITITANPLDPSLLDYGSAASVMSKEELRLRSEPTIGETLSNEPGVSSTYFGPGASRPVIRGNAGERVRVLQNGVSAGDISNTSEDHAISSNPLAAEKIEILRGPETLLYGSSAIGGVVNIIDSSIPETPIVAPVSAAAEYRQATGDNELSGAGVLEGQAGDFNWHLDYFYQDTDDIDIPGFAESEQLRQQEEQGGEAHEEDQTKGTLPNSETRSQGFTSGGSYIWDKGFFGASVTGWESNYGVPGHAHAEEGHGDEEHSGDEEEDEEHSEDGAEEENVAIDAKQLRANARGRFDDVSEQIETVRVKLGWSTYKHKELENGDVGSTFDNDELEGRVELSHAPIGPVEGVIGFQSRYNELSADGEEAFLPNTDTLSPAMFLYEELSLNDYWSLQAGGRYEYVTHDADGFSRDDYNPFSLSTGALWDPTGAADYTLGLSFTFAKRAPAATELYSDGPHIARQIFEVGDPNLGDEQSYGFDLTMKKNTGIITGEVNFFYQDFANYINLAGTGEEQDELPVYQYDEVRARFWGFEAASTLHLHEILDLWAHDFDLGTQVDFVRARNNSDSEDLARIPPLRTIVGLDYTFRDVFGAGVEGVFVEQQDKVADFELPTDSYQMLNASANVTIPVEESYSLELFARGTNLNDQEARVHSSFIKDLAPLRGRSFLFGVRGTF